jgi:hypothetical protein
MSALPSAFVDVLEGGDFCHVAAATGRGPHLTPLVFTLSDERLWVTTSRGSVKVRAWRIDPRVAGVVRHGDRSVSFSGTATTYDALDPLTWERGILRSAALGRATLRFTRKNARFFAGYALDARHVPLSWTPPGRVFVEISIERAALMSGERVEAAIGGGAGSVTSKRAFRRLGPGPDPLDALPSDLGDDLSFEREAVVALDDGDGAAVGVARWTPEDGTIAVAVPRDLVGRFAGRSAEPRAALVLERASWWRARRMTGAMLQGPARVFDPAALRSGGRMASELIARSGADPGASLLVRLRPERVVWWRGWGSGSRVVT